jgi:competence protein ComEC
VIGTWRTAPIAPLAAAFACGISGASHVDGTPAWIGWCAAIGLTTALLIAGRDREATFTLLVAVLVLGALRAATPPLPPNHLARLALPVVARLEGRLAAEPADVAPERTRLLLDADTLVADTLRPVTGRVQLMIYGEPPPLTQGQRVAGEFRLYPPRNFRNPGAYDYAAHLARQDIFVVGSGRAERVRALSPTDPPWNVALRRRARAAIQGALPPVSAALLAGLLFGERTALPPEIDDGFRRAGVYHILAVSGFNVALLAAAVFAALALTPIPRRVVAALAVPVVIGFAYVVGPEPSVVRAVVMAALLLAAIVIERTPTLLNSLALAGLLILAARPLDLWEPGFQLSFAATLGIVLVASALTARLAERGCAHWLAGAVAVSVGAQAFVTPLMLHHFNQLSLIGVAANLAVVPLAGLATLGGMLALLAATVSTALTQAIFDGLWLVLLGLRGAVYVAARIPAAMLHLPAPPSSAMAAFYAGLGVLVATGTEPIGSSAQAPQRERLAAAWRRPARMAVVILVGTAAAIEAWPLRRPPDGRLRVTFLDVGQGDAIVVALPDGRAVLVDTGTGGPARFDIGERVIAPYLWNRGVRRLAILVTTHEDIDHAGGAASVRRLFPVGEEWTSAGITAGSPRFLGGVGLTVLNPRTPRMTDSRRGVAANRNNNGVVLRLDYGLASLLLAADIEAEAEARLLATHAPLRARVLKVAHHGARHSTGEAFLRATRPDVAVISVGARNPFGHPAPATLARLARIGARIYRTDEDGAVILETDGRELVITAWADRRTDRLPLRP